MITRLYFKITSFLIGRVTLLTNVFDNWFVVQSKDFIKEYLREDLYEEFLADCIASNSFQLILMNTFEFGHFVSSLPFLKQ